MEILARAEKVIIKKTDLRPALEMALSCYVTLEIVIINIFIATRYLIPRGNKY